MQELLVSRCKQCGTTKMAWVGIDFAGRPIHQEPISAKKHDYWIERTINHRSQVSKSKSLHSIVMGGYRDRKSGHWIPAMVAVR